MSALSLLVVACGGSGASAPPPTTHASSSECKPLVDRVEPSPACEKKLEEALTITTEPAMRFGEAKNALQAFVEDPAHKKTDEGLTAKESSLNERFHTVCGRPLPKKAEPAKTK